MMRRMSFYFGNPKPLHPQTDDAVSHAVEFIRKSFARVRAAG